MSCGDDPGPEKPTVALVMKSLANEFFKTMADGAEAYQADHAEEFELIVNGIRNETDLTAQVNLVEQMVSRGVDAIVIAPADSKALAPALKRAMDTGVTVVNIDNQLDAEVLAGAKLTIPFVGPDNREGAKMVGDVVAGKLQPGDAVAIIEGVPTAFNAVQRRLGFEDAMKAGGMKIVSSQSGSWEMAKANAVASAILSEHPEVKALLCANDSMALGAVTAVKAAGVSGKVLVAGFDNISAITPLVESGEVVATADQHADDLAVFGIQAALDILAGGTAENQKTKVDLVVKPQ
tara:strand:+ start:2523 stop:3401 length:879 start_codon:yes stop_codon:yes gene_type:complete